MRLVDAVVGAEGRLDILVNAAGGVRGQVGRPIEEIDEADWRVIFEANVDGAFWLAQAAAPAHEARRLRPPRLHRVGRRAAAEPDRHPGLYGRQARAGRPDEAARRRTSARFGITCNAIAPGFVRSNPSSERQWEGYGAEGQQRLVESIHTRRLGTAEDIANAALFFASEQASWITGQVLSVDGGRS